MIPTHLRGAVISHRNDRMGGRLIAMLNGLRVARDYDLPFFVGWTTGGRTSPEMRDPAAIFDADWVAKAFFDGDVMGPLYPQLTDLADLPADWTEAEFRAALTGGTSVMSSAAIGVTVLPWENAEDVAARLAGIVDHLAFSPAVAEGIARIDAAFAGTRLTAYHIRRGDIIYDPITSNKLWPNKFIPREFYEEHLARTLRDPEARALIFSDTPVEVTRLRATDPRVKGVEELFAGTDLHPGARDFLELFAMSRCPQIFGPPSSAFSQTAVTIGGGRLRAVEEALPPKARDRALERMTERLETRSELFLNMGDVGQCLPFLIRHQTARGTPARAKRIIEGWLDAGLDKSFAYQLLCELSVATDALPDCEPVRSRAYARPVYSDEAMAQVNAYAALHHLSEGAFAGAMERLQAGFWFRPLDGIVHGALNLGLTAGCVTPETFYPFDPALVRAKGTPFAGGSDLAARLNGIMPAGMDGRPLFTLWDLVVRDWRLVCGKRLNRAFSNHAKIARAEASLQRQFRKLGDAPALVSARGVLIGARGDTGSALNAQRAAVRAAPGEALYRKRLSDALRAAGREADALAQLRAASGMAQDHPCYRAELAWHLWQSGAQAEALDHADALAASPHGFVEVHQLTAELLRRDPGRLEPALAAIDRALALGHGAQRLLSARARLLMMLDRVEEARSVYEEIVTCGQGTEHTYVDLFRRFARLGREDIARDLTARSAFDVETVRALALA